jgi:hypothetical protein
MKAKERLSAVIIYIKSRVLNFSMKCINFSKKNTRNPAEICLTTPNSTQKIAKPYKPEGHVLQDKLATRQDCKPSLWWPQQLQEER